jgi:hypothetical protein
MKVFSFLFFLVCVVFAEPCLAQQIQQPPVASDTLEPPPTEQELANKKISNREPNKAALMSALVPGAGQIYNRKYWKAPLAWIGLGITAYLGHDYFLRLNEYSKAANLASKNQDRTWLDKDFHDYNLQTLTAAQLNTLSDDSRRLMYMNIIIFSGIYALNIVDAYVDAHLKEFDINDDLSFQVKPLFYTTNYSHLATGLTLSLRFK